MSRGNSNVSDIGYNKKFVAVNEYGYYCYKYFNKSNGEIASTENDILFAHPLHGNVYYSEKQSVNIKDWFLYPLSRLAVGDYYVPLDSHYEWRACDVRYSGYAIYYAGIYYKTEADFANFLLKTKIVCVKHAGHFGAERVLKLPHNIL